MPATSGTYEHTMGVYFPHSRPRRIHKALQEYRQEKQLARSSDAVQPDQNGFWQCVYYSSDRKHVENHFKSSTNPTTEINNSSGSNSSVMSISSSEDSQASSPQPYTDMLLSPTTNSPASSNPGTPNNAFKAVTPSRLTRTVSHPVIVHSTTTKPSKLQKRFSYEQNNNTKNNNTGSPKKKRSDDEAQDILSYMRMFPSELSKRVKTELMLAQSNRQAYSEPENTPPTLLHEDEYNNNHAVTPRTSSPIQLSANSPPPCFSDNTKIEDLLEHIQKKLLLADNLYNETLQKLHKEGFMIVSTLRQLTDELWSRLSLPLAVEMELKRELGYQSTKAMVQTWFPPHQPWSPIQPQSPILTPTSGNASPAQYWPFQQFPNMCPPPYNQPSFDEYEECELQRSAESNAIGSDDDLEHAVQEEREMADILPPVVEPNTRPYALHSHAPT
eukprot:CAMPEP_0168565438 /NCGR_PEP_ID=MMETSP0413-20121227/13844_1 /TAXON_ID=136452 /ORGANISM="Filamoeba nolandi, Strain NC-AS-23-1" /LENGTH=442 /DNA_ID=CAMNT_0008597307 /DNA_START=287 /DNA_END=1616 /DNA_ORIENTATION=+